jgi:hypothetical protein
MKNQEIRYEREEQDDQRYERQRERWLEGLADISQSKLAEKERQLDLPLTDERQPEDGQ